MSISVEYDDNFSQNRREQIKRLNLRRNPQTTFRQPIVSQWVQIILKQRLK
jgi:hypothetical protein